MWLLLIKSVGPVLLPFFPILLLVIVIFAGHPEIVGDAGR